jgi:putative membrane protein
MSRLFVSAVICGALALGAATFPVVAAPADAKPPRDFVRSAVIGDNGEIALGKLAERRASSAEVRAFARLIVTDHGRARQQALDLLRAAGKPAPDAPSAEAAAELRKLRGLSGRAFDREFVRFMADDHRRDIREYRAQAARRQGRSSRLAQMVVPTLRKHLRMAESLAPKVGLRRTTAAEREAPPAQS